MYSNFDIRAALKAYFGKEIANQGKSGSRQTSAASRFSIGLAKLQEALQGGRKRCKSAQIFLREIGAGQRE